MSLQGKTLFITGASRGIGLAIALRAARDGANVVIAAKSNVRHPRLPGTIHTAAAAVKEAGGQALAVACDIRDEAQIESAVAAAVETFGGIDICVNNASAIFLAGTEETPAKRFDLMHQVNTRGTFFTTRACLPHLKRASNPHVLMLSPPLDIAARWFAPHTAYSIAKYGMSLCVLGMSAELAPDGIAVNALWPRTAIATAAVSNVLAGEEGLKHCRTAEIIADAAHAIFEKPARDFTGRFLIDDTFLAGEGVTDFDRYRVDPTKELMPDFFVPETMPPPRGVSLAALEPLPRRT
ncbi:SDR family oxidoreductase [Rhizomicrobium electricum]|uniref:NAD(P)-dependent oxidoreductase n=1 Tax=Rhizomicrobium electricum TaxID=480070 RepID=A0ABP3PXN9_9PROT|nr:NAD(P)-dependent oxidoreductase [Rhizomicrobium electricum]NIJ50074.1 citronellol/citronellal dehydrogenase [Rhizomicrobium electricum]